MWRDPKELESLADHAFRVYGSELRRTSSSSATTPRGHAKGNRPSFSEAARPEIAEPLYERFSEALRATGVPVQTGVFGVRVAVDLVNDGPVTIVLDVA